MSRHLDGSPKPVDQLWHRQNEWLHVRCKACNRSAALHIGALALQHQLAAQTRLYEVIDRLRCMKCGGKATTLGVSTRR
ncbi:hypothetical protein [Roseicella sp. DB1501]|uniref:hypothetical protein n=1 Tax=Roseicella sp. DB1501 TaxID=2730925 RepID=UPI0014913FD6|nr:hypothetical protein [Roseicella sp. DB1501]NOG73717.1 hypothetical protein [Roseicella sp. DB1501]